jgi:hypothetical protein
VILQRFFKLLDFNATAVRALFTNCFAKRKAYRTISISFINTFSKTVAA